MSGLRAYLPARVMAFTRCGDDPVAEKTVLAEVTENDGEDIEFVFEVPNPHRRIYVMFRVADLAEAIKPYAEDPTP